MNVLKVASSSMMIASVIVATAQDKFPDTPSNHWSSEPIARMAPASEGRQDAIWNAIDNRLSSQIDIWFDDGDFPACIQLLRIQADLDPANYDTWTNLGWMQENVEDWEGAVATYLKYQRQNPSYPDRSLPLGEYYFRRKQYSKVPPILEPAIKVKGVHPNVYRVLAHSYERQGFLADSKRVWDQYITLAPNDETAKRNRERVEKKIAKG